MRTSKSLICFNTLSSLLSSSTSTLNTFGSAFAPEGDIVDASDTPEFRAAIPEYERLKLEPRVSASCDFMVALIAPCKSGELDTFSCERKGLLFDGVRFVVELVVIRLRGKFAVERGF
jgi:hypothetical protein